MNSRSQKTNKQNSKNAFYILEKTRQQLKLRNDYLHHVGIPDERALFSNENPQQLITFSNARATIVLENQAIEKANREKQQDEQTDFDKEETIDKYSTELLLPVDLLLPTVTSGESSPSESDEDTSQSRRKQKSIPTNTSLEDLLPYMIDSSLLTIERDAPMQKKSSQFSSNGRNDHGFIWGNCFELMFLNIDISLSSTTIKHDIKNKFYSMPYICFESMRTFFYQGKFSLLVTLANEKQAQIVFAYFRSHCQSFRSLLGDQLELYRVVVNNLNNPTKNNDKRQSQQANDQQNEQSYADSGWIPVIFRNLPGYFEKSNFQRILHMVALPPLAVKNIEEPILINSKKHCMAVLSDVDAAFTLICQLPGKLKEFPHFRVNLHPNYSKQSWRIRDRFENAYYSFYETDNQDRFQHSYSKTNQHLSFQKHFLEDVQNIHKTFKELRPSYLNQKQDEDDMKKLSQRSTTPIYHGNNIDIDQQEQSVAQNTPSALFNPINYNYEITQCGQALLKQRSNNKAGYSSPSEKQRISEFHAHMNRHSPDSQRKHRRHGIKDRKNQTIEEQMFHSSISRQERSQGITLEFHQMSPERTSSNNQSCDGELLMNSYKKEREFNSSNKKNSKQKPIKEQTSSKDEDHRGEEQNEFENEEMDHLRQTQLRDGQHNIKDQSKIRNRNSSNSSSDSSRSSKQQQQGSQHIQKDIKTNADLLTSSNKKHKSSNMNQESSTKEQQSHQKEQSMIIPNTIESETNAGLSEESKHLSIMQRINLQNQDKLIQEDKTSDSPNESRSRSRKTENEENENKYEDFSPPRNRISYEPEEQLDKITSFEDNNNNNNNNKKGNNSQGQRFYRKNSEEGELHYKRNYSTENNRYNSRNNNNNHYYHNNSEYNYHQNNNNNHNNNYKYRDMRRGRYYQYKNNQKNDDSSPSRNNSQRRRHSRSNSPRRFKHPRQFVSKYN